MAKKTKSKVQKKAPPPKKVESPKEDSDENSADEPMPISPVQVKGKGKSKQAAKKGKAPPVEVTKSSSEEENGGEEMEVAPVKSDSEESELEEEVKAKPDKKSAKKAAPPSKESSEEDKSDSGEDEEVTKKAAPAEYNSEDESDTDSEEEKPKAKKQSTKDSDDEESDSEKSESEEETELISLFVGNLGRDTTSEDLMEHFKEAGVDLVDARVIQNKRFKEQKLAGKKSYECEHCGKNFARKDYLTVHTRKHTGEGSNCRCEISQVKLRAPILQKFLDNDDKLELQALYALQSLNCKLDSPPSLLRIFFDKLYDEDVISEEAFYAWESSEDPNEQLGKGVALKSVTAFFTWLREADEDSNEEC